MCIHSSCDNASPLSYQKPFKSLCYNASSDNFLIFVPWNQSGSDFFKAKNALLWLRNRLISQTLVVDRTFPFLHFHFLTYIFNYKTFKRWERVLSPNFLCYQISVGLTPFIVSNWIITSTYLVQYEKYNCRDFESVLKSIKYSI